MSSLAAARADNFYNPPDWDPSKQGRNKYHKSHGALGKRANKLESHGILIIRFEMPFHVWCAGCNHLIGKGVRFNAEKSKIGKYHSTTIWKFVMKSPCCKERIEIHTDPKNAEYVVVCGAKKKAEPKGGEGVVSVDPRAEDRPVGAIGRLEIAEMDKRVARDSFAEIMMLREQSCDRYKDDVERNRELRQAMRGSRKEEKQRSRRRDELGLPPDITLLPETKMDVLRASGVDFGGGQAKRSWKQKRKSIASASIFGGGLRSRPIKETTLVSIRKRGGNKEGAGTLSSFDSIRRRRQTALQHMKDS